VALYTPGEERRWWNCPNNSRKHVRREPKHVRREPKHADKPDYF